MGTTDCFAEKRTASNNNNNSNHNNNSDKNNKMPEIKVPMTLRDKFMEDPFSTSSLSMMDKSSMKTSSSCCYSSSNSSVCGEKTGDNTGLVSSWRPWMIPRQWMMPPLLDHSFPELKDCHLLGQEEDETKLEISLNTVGYKPEELKVNVCQDEVRVEGRHEENNEEGKMMVRRQFVRRYTLPQEADRHSIVSNLSQDGVMVITVPKLDKVKEVKAAETIKVEHVETVGDMNNKVQEKENERKRSRGETRMDDFPRPGEMQARRRSLSKVGRSRASSGARKNVEELKKNDETKEQLQMKESKKQMEDLPVPMTLRNTFFQDPFFKDTLANMENIREDFFKKARQNFEESIRQMESRMMHAINQESSDFKSEGHWMTPKNFNAELNSMFNDKDIDVIHCVDDETKLEVHLDTAGYKPDELKVEAGKGVITVVGKHEEKDSAGQVRVSRQFYKEYMIPQGCREEEVVSSLSKDGVLVVPAPRHKSVLQEGRRNVDIARR